MRHEHTLAVEAPVERLWAMTVDVESWPSFVPTMSSVERLDDGPLRIGSRARVKQPGQRAAVWTVTRLEADEHFAWEATVLGVPMLGSHILSRGPAGELRNTVALELFGSRAILLNAVLRGAFKGAIRRENEAFKATAERPD